MNAFGSSIQSYNSPTPERDPYTTITDTKDHKIKMVLGIVRDTLKDKYKIKSNMEISDISKKKA